MTAPLLVEERDDRVVVTLNRPDKRNAIDLVSQAVLFEDEEKRARMTAFLDRGQDLKRR